MTCTHCAEPLDRSPLGDVIHDHGSYWCRPERPRDLFRKRPDPAAGVDSLGLPRKYVACRAESRESGGEGA